MAAFENDPSQWRLHSLNSNVPIKYLGLSGEFDTNQGSLEFKCLVYSAHLMDFLIVTFPPSIQVGNLSIPQSSGLPGLPGMTATKVTFKGFDDGKPVDPFGFDPNASSNTYNKLLEVTVHYGLNKIQQPDPNDPKSFLEVNGSATGEFIHSTCPKGKWRKDTRNANDPPDATPPAGNNNPLGAPVQGTGGTGSDPVADPSVEITIIVPKIEWTVKWKSVPYNYFRDVLKYRLDWCQGKVNSGPLPFLYVGEPETLLFMGYNHTEEYSWRDGSINIPPLNIEMKFVQKRLIWNGLVIGHNHYWTPSKGWQYLLIDGASQPTYQSRDFSVMFRV